MADWKAKVNIIPVKKKKNFLSATQTLADSHLTFKTFSWMNTTILVMLVSEHL
jgi:hypothetical protein